jgi:hypothetical protein
LKKEWCIPPKATGACVAQMEEVLDLSEKPYDSRYPLLGMDETSNPLLDDAQPPLPAKPGQIAQQDYEYARNGGCNLFMCFEPLQSRRHVQVTDQRTAVDGAHFMSNIAQVHYPNAKRSGVVMDNLNTHGPGSFYEAFAPAQAKRRAARFEFHDTPKHGSWLNMAEIELSAWSRMGWDRRVPDKAVLIREISAWESERNAKSITVEGRFTTDAARIKLKRLYPTISV